MVVVHVNGLVSEGLSACSTRRAVVLEIGADGISFLRSDGEGSVLIPFSCLRVQRGTPATGGWVLRGTTAFPALYVSEPGAVELFRQSVPPHVAAMFGARPRVAKGGSRVRAAVVAVSMLVILVGAIGFHSFGSGGSLASTAIEHLPASFESRLGDTTLARVQGDAPAMHDPVVLSAAQELAELLLAEVGDLPFDFRLAIVSSNRPDIVVLPGGRMVVYSGMIAEAESAEEMAAIFAHQIQHAVHRHPLRAFESWMERSESLDWMGVVFGSDANAAGSCAAALSSAVFSREEEMEVDSETLALLARTGIPANSLAAFYDRQAASSRASNFNRIHGITAERARDVREAADKLAGAARVSLEHLNWADIRRRALRGE